MTRTPRRASRTVRIAELFIGPLPAACGLVEQDGSSGRSLLRRVAGLVLPLRWPTLQLVQGQVGDDPLPARPVVLVDDDLVHAAEHALHGLEEDALADHLRGL